MSDFDITRKMIHCKHPEIFILKTLNGFETECKSCSMVLNSARYTGKKIRL